MCSSVPFLKPLGITKFSVSSSGKPRFDVTMGHEEEMWISLGCTRTARRDSVLCGPGSELPYGDTCGCGNSTLLSVVTIAGAAYCGIFRTCSVSEDWRSLFSRCGLIRGSSNSTGVLTSMSLVLTYTQPIRSSAVNSSLRVGEEGEAETAGERQSETTNTRPLLRT